MVKRNVITIDEEKCVGCGQCVNSCVGGALELVNGKAKLVREDYCDGLGVCVGTCPVGALKVEEKETEPCKSAPHPAPEKQSSAKPHACPGKAAMQFNKNKPHKKNDTEQPSELGAWPVQLHLVSPTAPQFIDADILIAASCSAFAFGSFHSKLLSGKGLVMACPKLDRTEGYIEKLTEIFASAAPRSITIARMQVPCCSGLTNMVTQARNAGGSNIEIKEIIISLQGEILAENII
jgi:NAD-dependent dihydropyrimidine dehydrogenase PreA subunit